MPSVGRAAIVLVHVSLFLGAIGFILGLVGVILAVATVHSGKATHVDLLTYPVGNRPAIAKRDTLDDLVEVVSLPSKRSSKLSLDL